MERKNRLNHTLDIQRVRRYGKSIAHPFFVLIYDREKSVDNAPVGVIASKAAAELHENIQPDCMVLLLARKAILDHDTPEITELLAAQLKKAGIFRESSQE